ncbi:TetR/AcrR family transcriptional regulator [Amycolatopsis pithecellobii]|uniref:TetR family transcriptional regulator n=1 Tax=Amycolatopsis pithecellobii TaxID=664692 RepID=A0A6N7YSR9_9PSEU|nr:TetR/AcrR family transcriptional regulator [Amycolatopsis pithecellobii]MTD56087.1 TetR family transcriptional regulator [Amycolatopsis pithecellobii]
MVGNRERIVLESLRLFNENGFDSVSTNQISRELEISPGNLYYHFRNKEEIASELYSRMTDEVRANGSWDSPITPAGVARIYVVALDIIQRFRFVFADSATLMHASPSIASRHRDSLSWATGRLVALFEELRALGHFRRPDLTESSVGRCATTTAVVFVGWWQYLGAVYGERAAGHGHLEEGARQAFSIVEPHLTDSFASEITSEIERLAASEMITTQTA